MTQGIISLLYMTGRVGFRHDLLTCGGRPCIELQSGAALWGDRVREQTQPYRVCVAAEKTFPQRLKPQCYLDPYGTTALRSLSG